MWGHYSGTSGIDVEGVFGEGVAGPPWILGHRGVPNEAPENTLAGMRMAADLGLDGFEYDLRGCATSEPVLIHDKSLDRTTDATGPIAARTLPELFGIDAGSWFARRYIGEPLPLFDEVIEIAGGASRGWPRHMIELKERGLVDAVAEKLHELGPQLPVYIASFLRDVVIEGKRAGFRTMLLGVDANEEDRRFVRDERLTSYGVGPAGWSGPAADADWSFCERWAWSVDLPQDLMRACRMPLTGFNTNEPRRAMATRALVHLAEGDTGPYPVEAPLLEVDPEALENRARARGEWYGSWATLAGIRNPFPFPVRVRANAFFPNGAFEVDGLPRVVELGPGESDTLRFRLTGGSRSPGGDPLLAALYEWSGDGSRAAGRLLLDAPMPRCRIAHADGVTRRLTLLRERPDDSAASLTMRREGDSLVVSIENAGDLEHPHVVARLAGETARGGMGLRMRLPATFDGDGHGVDFSCGIEGVRRGEHRIRRWAGGVPEGLGHGSPGRLLPLSTS
ncbi:MAG: hypothetical protein GY711_01435 [bacterium]|nr:hypothetical protein [bacterium]